MSVAFSPIKIGAIEVKKRFVRAATYECMATKETGEVTAAPCGEINNTMPLRCYNSSPPA